MIIYKTTNLLNEKIYIGRTIKSIEQRKREHEHPKKLNYFQYSLKLNGKENFKWEVIKECSCLKDLTDSEIYYIRLFKSNNPDFGYNLTEGGEGGLLGYKHSQEYKDFMSKIQKGKINSNYKHGKYSGKHYCKKCHKELENTNTATLCKSCCKIGIKFSKEHRKNMSLSKLGDLNPAKREEVRRKISETVKKRWQEGVYKKIPILST